MSAAKGRGGGKRLEGWSPARGTNLVMNLLLLQDHPTALRCRPDDQGWQHLPIQDLKMMAFNPFSPGEAALLPGTNPGVLVPGSCVALPTPLPSVSISTPGKGASSPACASHLQHLPQTTRPDTPRLSDNHRLHQQRNPTVGGMESARTEQTRLCPGLHAEE